MNSCVLSTVEKRDYYTNSKIEFYGNSIISNLNYSVKIIEAIAKKGKLVFNLEIIDANKFLKEYEKDKFSNWIFYEIHIEDLKEKEKEKKIRDRIERMEKEVERLRKELMGVTL